MPRMRAMTEDRALLKLAKFLRTTTACMIPLLTAALMATAVDALPKDTQKTALPVIMYHSILDNNSRVGKYVILPSTLEQDFKYIKEQGYTSVTLKNLLDYSQNKATLPDKPILITLDDGYYNNYTNLYPLLEKYDMHAVISIIGKYTDLYSEYTEKPSNNYSHMSWDQVRELLQSGRVELANHSYDMHGQEGRHGLKKDTRESQEHFLNAVKSDISKMQSRMSEELGTSAQFMAYPFGYYDEDVEKLVQKMGFLGSFSCYERVNVITPTPESMYLLGRFNRPHGVSTYEFFSKVVESEKKVMAQN